MTFWQFLDKQIGRIKPTGVAGAGIFVLTFYVLRMLSNKPELAEVDLFKTLSQAIVVQGLVGLAMAAWFTRNNREGVQDTRIVNRKNDPVPVDPELEDAP